MYALQIGVWTESFRIYFQFFRNNQLKGLSKTLPYSIRYNEMAVVSQRLCAVM